MIDDASQDSGKEIIKRYKSLNIHLHVLNTNSGPATARNVGILNSKGKYLYFLDVDDEIEDETFNILFDVVKEDDYDLVFSDKNGSRIQKIKEAIFMTTLQIELFTLKI